MTRMTAMLQHRRFVPAVCLLALLSVPAQAQTPSAAFVNTLMPQPASVTASPGTIPIAATLGISLSGASNPLLLQAAHRTLDALETKTGVQLGRSIQPTETALIQVEVKDASAVRPTLGVDESYVLLIESGRISLKSQTTFGAIHGLGTLLQLVQPQGSGFVFPLVHIHDAPRFPWRGLLLDPGRHFLTVEQTLRTLDGMAAVKLNVLHWHLTEDQGFRIESKRFPRLHEFGSEGAFYTQQQVREIVAYATARGIRVIPEFDMPAHSLSWMVGYPDLGSQPGPFELQHENRIADTAMDPSRESTYTFLDSFFGDMATLFPDEYVHIGGDESRGRQWLANPQIVHFMEQHQFKDVHTLQGYFNQRVQALLKKYGKQMVGWDEILSPDLAPEVVVQNWHGIDAFLDSARHGRRGFLSQPYYLDQMYTTEKMYLADPLPASATLSPEQAKNVLGGEACMWGEQVNTVTADSRIWPATAAIAERFWSPAATRDVADMYRRLTLTSLRLDALGLTHISASQRGLRQIAGSEAGAEQLAVLTSVMQPVSFHERAREQHTSAITPLDHLVDFTRPDPASRYQLGKLVDEYLAHKEPTQKAALEEIFQSWISVQSSLDKIAATQPFIAEMQIRRKQLTALGRLGSQAIHYSESHQEPPQRWVEEQQTLLNAAAQHVELTDFVVLDPLRKLVEGTVAP